MWYTRTARSCTCVRRLVRYPRDDELTSRPQRWRAVQAPSFSSTRMCAHKAHESASHSRPKETAGPRVLLGQGTATYTRMAQFTREKERRLAYFGELLSWQESVQPVETCTAL